MARILIAEDEPRIVSFLEKGLRANGYTTMAAPTGTEALPLGPRPRTSICCCSTSGCPGWTATGCWPRSACQ